MAIVKCKNCGKPVLQMNGKRAKEFCNVTCRSGYWQKQKRKSSERKPNSPQKIKKFPQSDGQIKQEGAEKNRKLEQKQTVALNTFMGYEIPKGLVGIDLAIWKAKIKEENDRRSIVK